LAKKNKQALESAYALNEMGKRPFVAVQQAIAATPLWAFPPWTQAAFGRSFFQEWQNRLSVESVRMAEPAVC
jgi:hypothetical protein